MGRTRRTTPHALAALAAVASLVLAADPVGAQAPPSPAPRPNVLVIVREQLKPGRAGAHETHEAAWARAFQRAGSSLYYIGMTANSGPAEAWYLAGYQSLAELAEQERRIGQNPTLSAEVARLYAGEEAFVSDTRTIVARHREDLSFGTPTHPNDRRVYRITTVRVRPGAVAEFERHRQLVRDATMRAGIGRPYAVYEVTAGMPAPTFLFLSARRDLGAFDDTTGAGAYRAALGDEGRATLARIARDAVIFTESNIFTVSPRMSHVQAEIAAMDAAYWRPAPAATNRRRRATQP